MHFRHYQKLGRVKQYWLKPTMVAIAFTMVLSNAILIVPGYAQSLTYNSAWGFQSPSARNTKLSRLDLELRKQAGFFNDYETNIFYDGNTFNTFDCVGSNARSVANDSVNSQDAATSSPSTGSELDLRSSAVGNSSEVEMAGVAQNTTSQEASGANTSQTSLDLVNNTGVLNAGGGTSEQTASVVQSNEGSVSSSATDGVGCNFYTPELSAGAENEQ